ncbi:toxin-antitoxin system YwqK family antitoxin [Acidiluteibacter ferrifornacis]|jgi:antitoxin component YwqK of YwqJK toxin-antitoxin module|uniref:Toxin-antitoxin system YwqK family antitoxin n=1 Tax=Acidiluteibacter ferrifornacis TaxID=2692424 RepID=A0A6N9NFE0_9FLAO|nr:hypothetical protein [Acidiluteibacter ferrifornacis]MBR9830575.1 hypothetical protein [bacterium]NBG64593.1 hypothetical protein [Acidiluteibacter ferrifornacis]
MVKRILFVAFVAAIVACGDSTPKSELDKVKSDSAYADSTGIFQETYPNGKLKIKGYLNEGKRDGVWEYYYENGFTWSKGVYKNGVREGYSMVYHENGVKKIQGEYKEGKAAGIWKFWSEQGELIKEVNIEEDGMPAELK